MASLQSFLNPAPYHLLCYGTLLGSQIFQSISGVIAYQALPRPQFSQLQQKIFPLFFGMQALMPVVLAATYPAASALQHSSFAGVWESSNFNTILLPLAVMTACGMVNWGYLGPTTTSIMRRRKAQETKEGKKYWDEGPKSEEMKKLNSDFGKLHGISAMVNLIEILVTMFYGVIIAARL
ncbi:hypothetical protein BT63DRAFT_460351 [Microthyrium microscopicum]|uniref:TMEM205-like domain-containing protein n=1 Tax=Microthyrium microscopicum TaxID=703497 RepID=A0A6A6TWE0_9PEZI|nr:hypothetical protein BT63DRAFT_460351 [Microthyrium microscopicum]